MVMVFKSNGNAAKSGRPDWHPQKWRAENLEINGYKIRQEQLGCLRGTIMVLESDDYDVQE
jgi:hypothetical protein